MSSSEEYSTTVKLSYWEKIKIFFKKKDQDKYQYQKKSLFKRIFSCKRNFWCRRYKVRPIVDGTPIETYDTIVKLSKFEKFKIKIFNCFGKSKNCCRYKILDGKLKNKHFEKIDQTDIGLLGIYYHDTINDVYYQRCFDVYKNEHPTENDNLIIQHVLFKKVKNNEETYIKNKLKKIDNKTI
jgi:hypothetical protein